MENKNLSSEEMFARGGSELTNTPINKGNKTRKIITGMLVVVLMVLLIGVSYAVYRYTFTGSLNLLEKEMIELELLEDTNEVINITNALPISDTKGIEEEQTFNFAVTTRTAATTDIFYNLKIEKLNVDSGYTALEDSAIRIYLTDYNDKALIAPIKISDLNNYTFYKTYNSHTPETTEVTTKYKLKVWVDWDVDASSWNKNTKLQYKFKIGVKGEEYNSDAVNLSNKVIPEGAYYLSMDAETGAPTIQNQVPETVSENDAYVYGDYLYVYSTGMFGGWGVLLATTESFSMFGLTEVLADYPVTDKNQTSYDPILDTVNGASVMVLYATFNGCTNLEETPAIPKSVMMSVAYFVGSPALKSDTNIYSYYVGDLYEASTLDTITNYTTDYKSLNKTVFLKHNIGVTGRIESQEVCYVLNGNKYCLKGGGVITNLAEGTSVSPYYEENIETLYASFGEENCSVNSNRVDCSVSGLRARANDNGIVGAHGGSSICNVNLTGNAGCDG